MGKSKGCRSLIIDLVEPGVLWTNEALLNCLIVIVIAIEEQCWVVLTGKKTAAAKDAS